MLITVTVGGMFNASRGNIVKILEAYVRSANSMHSPHIKNLTTGESGTFGRSLMTIPLTVFPDPIIGLVEKVERQGAQTILTVNTSLDEAFLSYNHLDRRIAGEVKRELEKVGVKCFLAHEEIDVSSEWRGEIARHLDSCGIFIPLITGRFNESAWANQETGYAIAKHKLVIPLIIDGARITGIVEGRQGVIASSSDIKKAVEKLNAGLKSRTS